MSEVNSSPAPRGAGGAHNLTEFTKQFIFLLEKERNYNTQQMKPVVNTIENHTNILYEMFKRLNNLENELLELKIKIAEK